MYLLCPAHAICYFSSFCSLSLSFPLSSPLLSSSPSLSLSTSPLFTPLTSNLTPFSLPSPSQPDVFLAFPDLSLGDNIQSQSNFDKKSKKTHHYLASSSVVEVIPCMTATIEEETPVVSAHLQSVCKNTPSNRQSTLVPTLATLEVLETELF